MAEQTIRVNVPDGYEVVSISVPRAGVDLILCDDHVIVAPPTVYSRVIVRKVKANDKPVQPHCDDASDLVAICRRADQLRDKVMQTWDPPRKMRDNEGIATVAQTATMQTIAYIMGPEFMGKMDRNQQQAIDSGLVLFRAAFESAKP